MPHRLFDIGKVGVFCDAISHTTEKRKDDPEVKVIQLTLRVQPFDSKLAGQVRQDVRQTLFKLNAPSEPQAHLARVNFALGVPRQNVKIFASSDTEKASILIEHMKISGVYARTEKNVNGYALVWKATFGPASKQELEFVENWRNGQRFCTFDEADQSLEFDPPSAQPDDADEHDDDQPDLPEGEFETDTDGLPKGDAKALVKLLARAGANVSLEAAAAWSGAEFDEAAKWGREQVTANEEADPGTTSSIAWPDHVSAAHHAMKEPARQRLHSHAGGKKKTAKAQSRGAAATKARKR